MVESHSDILALEELSVVDSSYCSLRMFAAFEPFAIVELNNCWLFGYKLSDHLVEPHSDILALVELSVVDSSYYSLHRFVALESFAIVNLHYY